MIWLYVLLAAWGGFVIYGNNRGAEKIYDDYVKADRQSGWMFPANLTAFILLIVGVALAIDETLRIYGAYGS